MDYGFTPSEILFIYGYFKKQIVKLERLKKTKQAAISSINTDIKLFTSIVDKIETAHPNLKVSHF